MNRPAQISNWNGPFNDPQTNLWPVYFEPVRREWWKWDTPAPTEPVIRPDTSASDLALPADIFVVETTDNIGPHLAAA